jgi:hypothetical protein
MQSVRRDVAVLATTEDAFEAYATVERLWTSMCGLSDATLSAILDLVSRHRSIDRFDANVYESFAVSVLAVFAEALIAAPNFDSFLDALEGISAKAVAIARTAASTDLPTPARAAMTTVFGSIAPIMPQRRRLPHGQAVVARAGGVSKKGDGPWFVLALLLACAHADTYTGRLSYTAPQVFNDLQYTSVNRTGFHDIVLQVAVVNDFSVVGSFACFACFNGVDVPTTYLASDTTSCQVAVLSRYATSSAARTQPVTVSVNAFILDVYPLNIGCVLETGATGVIQYALTTAFSESNLPPGWQRLDGKKIIGMLGAGASKGDGPRFGVWLKQHPKLADATHEEQMKAYRNAIEQEKGKGEKSVAVVKEMKQSVQHQKAARHRRVNLVDNPYTRCVLDPFSAPMARVPDHEGGPTVLFKMKQIFTLQADTNGNAAVFLRPGLGNAIARSGPMSDASIPWLVAAGGAAATYNDLPDMVFDAANGVANYWSSSPETPFPPAWSADSYAIQRFSNFDKTRQQRELFGSTRVVSAGMSVRNIANMFNAQGRIAMVNWEGDIGAPGFGNQNINIGRTNGDTGDIDGPIGLTFDNVAVLDGAEEVEGPKGATMHAVITGARAQTDFRQTTPRAMTDNIVARAAYNGSSLPEVPGIEFFDFPPAMCDSAVTQRFCDTFAGLNPTVTSASRTITSAPATGQPLQWLDDVVTLNTLSDYASRSLYGDKLEQSATSGADNTSLNIPIVQKAMQRQLKMHSTSAMSPGDCGLLMMFTNLIPSEYEADGTKFYISKAAEPFEVEVVVVFEAIPRTGTVSFEKQHVMPAKARLAAPIVRSVSLDALQVVPISHPGPHETEPDAAGAVKSATPVAQWIRQATSAVADVSDAVGGATEALPWLADAAAALFAFL